MSLESDERREAIVEPLICEFCGGYITEPDQRCAALEDGRCRP